MAKYLASEAGMESALGSMWLHGADGSSKEYPVELSLRDAPLKQIGEGAELQRKIIARLPVARTPV